MSPTVTPVSQTELLRSVDTKRCYKRNLYNTLRCNNACNELIITMNSLLSKQSTGVSFIDYNTIWQYIKFRITLLVKLHITSVMFT